MARFCLRVGAVVEDIFLMIWRTNWIFGGREDGFYLDLEVWRVVRMGSLSGLDGWDRIGLCSSERRESELVVVIDG
jgi:hypothetical protein